MVFACMCQFLLGVSHAASLAGLGKRRCIVVSRRVKHLHPAASVLVTPVLVARLSLAHPSGLIAAWMYLRFFKIQEDGSWGDRRSDFEFVTMLPEATRFVFGFNWHLQHTSRSPSLPPVNTNAHTRVAS